MTGGGFYRRRGLNWEDKLVANLKEQYENGEIDAHIFNLGGATTFLPDIFIQGRYNLQQYRNKIEFAIENSLQRWSKRDALRELNKKIANKWLASNYVISIECKATKNKYYNIAKEEVDKCFNFISYLDSYERYIILAWKFFIKAGKGGNTTIKNPTYFFITRYHPYNFFQDFFYNYVRCDIDGNLFLYYNRKKAEIEFIPHEYNNNIKVDKLTQKLIKLEGKLDIESI
jgi:hypothetical protein